jgi:hypothetical protein
MTVGGAEYSGNHSDAIILAWRVYKYMNRRIAKSGCVSASNGNCRLQAGQSSPNLVTLSKNSTKLDSNETKKIVFQ